MSSRTLPMAQAPARAILRGRRRFALESTIGAPDGEGIRAMQARLEPGALLSARLAGKDGWRRHRQMRGSTPARKRSVEDAMGAGVVSPGVV